MVQQLSIKDNGKEIKFMDMEFKLGLTPKVLRENSLIINFTEVASQEVMVLESWEYFMRLIKILKCQIPSLIENSLIR